MSRRLLALGVAALLSAAQPRARADVRVEAPRLAAPERGSLAGAYGGVAFTPDQVARGSFALPSALAAPGERGALVAPVFPNYAPDAGLSEWGMGWAAPLAITRFRARGEVRYDASDDLTGPSGRMVRGSDGAYYPAGLRDAVRVITVGDALVAFHGDGSRWTYGGVASARLAGERGVLSWYLSQIDELSGARTRLTWSRNPSGRPFLTAVEWGGRGDDFQARITLEYDAVPVAFVSFATGTPAALDRRVAHVRVATRHTVSGAFVERWNHELLYQQETWGAAWFLAEVRTHYPSADAPPVRYGYGFGSDQLLEGAWRRVPEADALLASFGDGVLDPKRSALTDTDLDGRLDVEVAENRTLLRRADAGFVVEPVTPAPEADPDCLPEAAPWSQPRLLAPILGDDAPRVVTLAPDAWMIYTDMAVCGRDGKRIGGAWLDGNFGHDSLVRLVDVDRDRRPDVVRVDIGEVHVVPNTSGDGTPSFGAEEVTWLKPVLVPTEAWVHDMNGDGLTDLVVSNGTSLTLWPGVGGRRFAAQGQPLELRTDTGLILTGLTKRRLQFFDANKDGLTDVLVSAPGSHALFVSNGAALVQEDIPAFAGIAWDAGVPVMADVSGSGGAELALARNGQMWALALEQPGTGLLASADDGKGTTLRFGYARAAAEAGARRRQVVLASLTVDSAGKEPVTFAYHYAGAALHGDGAYLIGFDHVTRRDPRLVHGIDFVNDDSAGSAPVEARREDPLAPGVAQIERHEYDLTSYQGVPWLRPRRDVVGFAQPGGSEAVQETLIERYQGLCPVTTVERAAGDELRSEIDLDAPAGLAGAPHCLAARTRQVGRHTDSSLDFALETVVDRDSLGRVTKVATRDGSEMVVQQEVAYHPDGTVASVAEPGKGVSRFAYEAHTLSLVQVAAPDGVVVIATRDPATGQLVTLDTRHGTLAERQGFAYDGLERFAAAWNDAAGTSPVQPGERVSYQYAAPGRLGLRRVVTLADGVTGAAREEVEVFAADGTAVGKLVRGDAGWEVHQLARPHADGSVETFTRAPLPLATDLTTLSVDTLWAGAARVGSARQSPLGVEGESRGLLHAGVEQVTSVALAVDNGGLRRDATENGAFTTRSWVDATGRVVQRADAAGHVTRYHLDIAGRVRLVTLADGTRHRVDYDAHGRKVRVVRDGVGTRQYTFVPGTSLLRREETYASSGAFARAVTFTYDAAGRTTLAHHADATGAVRDFVYRYDGAGQTGLLTGVGGDGFDRAFIYRGDGKVVERQLQLGAWRTVVTRFAYRADGAVAARDLEILDPQGVTLERRALSLRADDLGRDGAVDLDGAPLATLGYDQRGELAAAVFSDGSRADFVYDPLTRAPMGLAQSGAFGYAQAVTRRNARGFTAEESLTVGAATERRGYEYTAEGYLARVLGPVAAHYTYDPTGLPVLIEEQGASLGANAAGPLRDDLGRTVQMDDLTLHYGPDDQLAEARRGAHRWRFVHDEAGHRLLKLDDSGPVRAYLEEGVLEATGLLMPLSVGGKTLGIVAAGKFAMLPVDGRGSAIGTADGAARLASPFGRRAQASSPFAAALDYVKAGVDEDLGLVRMGVRDYDPVTHRFTTPDPLFLANPDKCVDSPVECNLYGYAQANPLDRWDPEGTDDLLFARPQPMLYGEWPVHDSQGQPAYPVVFHGDGTFSPAFQGTSARLEAYPDAPRVTSLAQLNGWAPPAPTDFGRGMTVGAGLSAGVGLGLKLSIGERGLQLCLTVSMGTPTAYAEFSDKPITAHGGFTLFGQVGGTARLAGFGVDTGLKGQVNLDGRGNVLGARGDIYGKVLTPLGSYDVDGKLRLDTKLGADLDPTKAMGRLFETGQSVGVQGGACLNYHYYRGTL
jgi:RHS repeat-associated protein